MSEGWGWLAGGGGDQRINFTWYQSLGEERGEGWTIRKIMEALKLQVTSAKVGDKKGVRTRGQWVTGARVGPAHKHYRVPVAG